MQRSEASGKHNETHLFQSDVEHV